MNLAEIQHAIEALPEEQQAIDSSGTSNWSSATYKWKRWRDVGKNRRHGRPPAGWQAKACPTIFHEISRAGDEFHWFRIG